jgi:hypothetical protein
MRNDASVTISPLDALISKQIDVAPPRPRQSHCGGAGHGSQPLGAAPSEGTRHRTAGCRHGPGQTDRGARHPTARRHRCRSRVVSGDVGIGDARRAAFAANAAAHVAADDLGAAAKAIRASAPLRPPVRLRWHASGERESQRERLPTEVRELVLDDQRSRSPICWNVFDDSHWPLRRLPL